MKLRRLELLRYGHLSDVTLEFPDEVRLHVVHGVNEAGKSTALAAIADALFGFGHLTGFDFLHGGPQLLLGITLASRDGREARFTRRKGRGNTLRDAQGDPVSDDALRSFLGGAGRELFEQRFGLSAERMRKGGEELLRAGGELGESMFAGLGILNLRAALAQLDDEAKALVGDGRGQRVLSQAVEAWRQASREADALAVPPGDWKAAEEAHQAALNGLAATQDQARTLSREKGRLERLRRVTPFLAELADARERLALLADAPELPIDAESRFRDLVALVAEKTRDATREHAEKVRLTEERAALPEDPAILAVQEAIDALAAEKSLVQQAGTDLTGVEAAVAGFRQIVAEAVADLGLALAPEAARDALPAPAARRAVQRLVSRHATLTERRNAAERAMAEARLRRDQARQALEAKPVAAAPELLRRTIESVRAEGPLDSDLARSEQALADAAHATRTALAALPLWSRDLASLCTCKLPLAADQEQRATLLDVAAKALEHAQTEARDLGQEIAALEEEKSRLSRGEAVPTPDAVKAARDRRDEVWRQLRRAREGDPASRPLPERFEQLRDEADRLADRRADEAQRVSDFLSATARLALLSERRREAALRLGESEHALEEAEAGWQALWAPADLVPGTEAAMSEWRRARERVLALAAAEAELRTQASDLSARRDRARARLAPLLADSGTPRTLAALLLRAETDCAAREVLRKQYETLKKSLSDHEEQLPALGQAMHKAGAELADWQQAWAAAAAALELPEEASIDLGLAALAAWDRIAETAPAWRKDERRISDMCAAIAGFRGKVHAVEASLAESAADESPIVIAARLARRLAAARSAAEKSLLLESRIAGHEDAARTAIRSRNDAEAELESLRRIAGAADDRMLEQAIARARARDALRQRIAGLEEGLLRQGDGMTEEVLRAEATAADPDAAKVRIEEIEADLSDLNDRREQLSAERTKRAAALATMQQGHDAAAKAQEAENALADAGTAAERYVRLHIARVLLRAGIDRFRKEQQKPFLRAAGAHFAALTGARYRRLIADFDSTDRTTLLAAGEDGAECPVAGLSEGTRDQLYLALRIAAVESSVAEAEPLPFIADDLLVQFDDARARAAIALLAQLGETMQVILFTHHDHIAALAGRQPGAAVMRMPPPPARAKARSEEAAAACPGFATRST